jgi:hypothetical protein
MTETQEDKMALFAKFVKEDQWQEMHLLNAVAAVYAIHIANDGDGKSYQKTKAAADAWTIHEKLAAKLYDETVMVWGKTTGEHPHSFPWNVDAVVETYESLRKGTKPAEAAPKADPTKFMSLLLLCVLRAFVENTNADKENQSLWESSKARSDTWARNSVLRNELVARVTNHWATLTGQPSYTFPWNATIVGRTYLVIRKTKKELDADIDKRRMQLEMFYAKKFKSAREGLNKRRTAIGTEG